MMDVNLKKISPVLVVMLVSILCFASYRVGVRHGREQNVADASGQAKTVESRLAVVEPTSVPPQDSYVNVEIEPSDFVPKAEERERARTEIEAEQKQRFMRNLSENLAMSGLNRILQEQQRVLMNDKYEDLAEAYGLNAMEKEYFLELLTARQMLQVDMGMKLMTGMLSEEDRIDLLLQVDEGMSELNREIDWFLNSEADSEYFQYYEQTEGERAIVDSLRTQLSQSGSPLEDGMSEELVAMMFDELNAYPFSVEFEENGEPVFARFTDENINTFVDEMQDLRDPLMQNAAQVLDPQQLDLFDNVFDQYVDFYDERFRMVQQFFNPAQ
ncbi:MAG: hypothetical protein JXR40_10635 [Pontiellaceae bacterium]|nr:hypothetical protein [Pontiellaceae bacterium]